PQSQETSRATEDKLLPLPLILNKELTSLKDKFQALAAKYPQLQSGAFFVDLDNGAYVDVEADSIFSAASTIKIPILVAFFEDVDAGKIHLDEKLTMTPEMIARGSGSMQYRKPGTQFSALETATKMIVISDNTATNMLIARLGGAPAINQRFLDWGMKVTVIRNPLPDLKGTNTTSPKDLANLLARIERGELVSLRSRDRILGIMKRTRTKTLLPRGLDKGAIIAHKTGDIGSILGDAGVVDMPNGKRYIAAVMVKRPHNDYRARTLIQEISKTAYQHFKWYLPNSASKK
ncbi:MAG: serine hydrolase, partial [Prochloraceae cyanobacterium]